MVAICFGEFCFERAFIVALIILWGFDVPIDLATISLIPKTSQTALTGPPAGGPVRAVCEVLGIKDIVAKSMGTSNPHNMIRATMKALSKQNSPKHIATIRNKKISDVIEKRG